MGWGLDCPRFDTKKTPQNTAHVEIGHKIVSDPENPPNPEVCAVGVEQG